MEHPYFLAYAAIGDNDPALIAWILSVIEERRARHAAAATVAQAAAAAAAAGPFSPPPGSSPEPGSVFMYN